MDLHIFALVAGLSVVGVLLGAVTVRNYLRANPLAGLPICGCFWV